MSIQKLFGLEKNVKSISSVTMDQLAQDAESDLFIGAKTEEFERFRPPVDYLKPEDFVSYGSAEKYYTKSFDYIRKTYPYDGSLYEKQAWENSASNLDIYLLENKYPRTTGYAVFSPGTWGAVAATSTAENYGLSDDVEYISVNSGPRGDETVTGSIASLYSDNALNVYDGTKDREDNLKFDLASSGVTIEFWLKKESFDNTKTGREVIFDLWNGATSGSAAEQNDEYGRLRLEMTGGVDAGTFLFTALSGASGVQYAEIGTTITTASVATNTWNHYALTMKNDASNIKATLYVNGEFVQTVTTGSNINRVYPSSGSIANLGSLRHSVSGAAASTADIGYGKLSGSIDEFRFWKKERTALQISRFWFNQVGGGANTDDNTTDLGLYYKFNEGITGTSSIDQTVLDYSGRMSNGTWTGYDSTARSTDSAIESYSSNFKENKDPIIYSNHADYIEAYTEMENTGSVFDLTNNKSLYHHFPNWIVEEDSTGEETLKNITQIMASYLDELSLQIRFLPRLNDNFYLSGSNSKPVSFAQRKLLSRGFMVQDLFTKSTITEALMDNDGERNYEEKLDNVRNFIYENIYNNLISIYKAKGTEKSFRQLLHCFGIDQDIFKINVYSTNDEYEFRDNSETVSSRARLVSFNPYASTTGSYNFKGSIYQMTSSDANTVSYLTGNTNVSIPMTFEGEFFFPKNEGTNREPYKNYNSVTSSLFGIHTAINAAGADEEYDTTWHTPDVADFQVYALRESNNSKKVKFMLTSSDTSGIPFLTSSFYDDVYDNNQWNFAVKVRPVSPLADRVEGSTESDPGSGGQPATNEDYVVEFYGISTIGNTITHEFSVSSSMDYTLATHFMTSSKRLYVGSHYTNFTSSDPLSTTDVRVLSNRIWLDDLTQKELRKHAYDIDNYGRHEPSRNAYLTISGALGDVNIPRTKTLALNWDYTTVTTSDADGSFVVPDASSGSSDLVARYGILSTALNNQHSGLGHNFPASDPNVVDVDYMISAKQQLPEIIQSSDMVNVLTDADDDLYTRDSMPVKYMLSIEKSMYQTISEEMLNMFASINDFNNLIGEPVNRYRPQYKAMEKLRHLFYENVANTPDLEKYVDFYKWFDSAIVRMLKQLVPATAITMDNADNIVESHVLERAKYWNKFPTLDSKHTTPEAVMKGAGELLYEWKYGHAPVPYNSIYALNFASGSNEYASIASNSTLVFSNGSATAEATSDSPFSIAMWLKFEDLAAAPFADDVHIIDKEGDYQIYLENSTGRLTWQIASGSQYQRAYCESTLMTASAGVENNEWHHYVFTYDGSGGTTAYNGLEIYINGVNRKSGGNCSNCADFVAMGATTNPLLLASGSFGSGFEGSMDELIIINKELSQAEITELYNSGCTYDLNAATFTENVVSWWQMGDGDTTSAIYDSRGDNNGTLTNTPTIETRSPAACPANADTRYNNLWWSQRAEREHPSITSGDIYADADRNNVLTVVTMQATSSGQNLTTVAGTQYVLDNYFLRNTTKPYRYGVEKVELKYTNKNNDTYKSTLTSERIVDSSTMIEDDFKDDQGARLYDGYGGVKKKKLAFQFFNTGSKPLDYDIKGYRAAPFGIYTSSVDSGYIGATGLASDFKKDVEINDLHRDLYHTFENEPLQGPFTEKYVGGSAHRHVKLLETDSRLRQESFFIEERADDKSIVLSSPGASSSANPVRYFREELAKRFVNIKNIKHTGSSPTTIGNYEHNYQVVQATGRDVNNLWFRSGSTGEGGVDTSGIISTAVSGVLDYTLPDRTYISRTTGSEPGLDRNRTVIAERFSAPGGPEVLSRGYLDPESETYSVYNSMNYRNSIVRDSLNYFSQISQTKFGNVGTTNNSTAASVILAFTGNPTTDETITIWSADGTAIKYIAKTSTDAANNEFKANGGAAANANALETCIEHASGHDGKITVANDGAGTLTLIQSTRGETGNTPVVNDLSNVSMISVNGHGGIYVFGFGGGTSEQVSVDSAGYDLAVLGTSSYHGVPGNALTKPTIIEPVAMWNTCSFSFDGTNDTIGHGTINGLDSMKYTWSIWFKPDSSAPDAEDYLIDQGASVQSLSYDFSTTKIKFYHAGSSGGAWSSPNGKITEDAWNHVAVALDATSANNDPVIYINGESVTVTEDSAPGTSFNAMGTSLYFGYKVSATSNYFKGLIDDAAFFNRVLEDHELKMLYNPTYAHTDGYPGPFNLEQHPAAPHMVAWYTFGDGPNDSASSIENMVLLNRCDHMQSGSTGTHPRSLTVAGAAASSDCITVRYNEIGLEDQRDNHFVRNVIPRSDKQYSWITASLVQHIQHGTNVDLDHQKNNQFERFESAAMIDGHISSSFHVDGYVQNLEFLSSSDLGSSILISTAGGSTYELPFLGFSHNTHHRSGSLSGSFGGGSYVEWAAANGVTYLRDFQRQDFAGLNTFYVDDFNTASNGAHIAGFPIDHRQNSTPVPIYGGLEARHTQYQNIWKFYGKGGGNYIWMANTFPEMNEFLTRRNGQYGYPTWKQIRAGQTQIPRNLFKKQNIYSVIDTYKAHPTPYSFPDHTDNDQPGETKDLTFRSFKEPAVTSRHKPMRHKLSVTNMNSDTGKIEDSNIAMAYTHANNEDTFATPGLKNRLNTFIEEEQMYDIIKDFYVGKDIDAPGNPVKKSLELTLVDTIYPRAEYTYLTKNRTRDLFDFEYWKSARQSTYDPVDKVTVNLLEPNLNLSLANKGRNDYNSFDGYEGTKIIPFLTSQQLSISGSDLATTGSMGQIITVHTGAVSGSTDSGDAIRDSFVVNQSSWPLDARIEFDTGHCVIMTTSSYASGDLALSWSTGVSPYDNNVKTKISGGYSGLDGAGELQNDYTIFHNGDIDQFACDYSDYAGTAILSGAEGGTAGLRAGVLYNRRILETEFETSTIFAAGDTKWQAAEQREQHLKVDVSGNTGPTWDSYEDFSEDLRLAGKDYTIVPEFRISEHMDFYIKQNEGNFRTINGVEAGPDGFLTLTGSTLSSSAVRDFDDFSQDFFHVYNTSDFLKNFKQVKSDHEGKHKPESLTFKCKALMKFLPYDGFFPATRTVQLASLFSQSYGDNMSFSGSTPHLRTAITPFFAPGILYNTIKSGIAVDYPIMTGSYQINGTNDAGFTHPVSASSDHNACITARGSGSLSAEDDREQLYGYRIPFEALVDPERYMDGIQIVDSEPHPSASLDSTASVSPGSDDLYKMAMHNFLAEVPSFFLKPDADDAAVNQLGDFTTFKSSQDSEWHFEANKKYAMEVVLTNGQYESFSTLFRDVMIEDTGGALAVSTQGANRHGRDINPSSVVMYERPFTPDGQINNITTPTNFVNYGSSFGPASETFTNVAGVDPLEGSVSYMPHTPPYYGGGIARCIIIYSQSHDGNATTEEVLEKSEFIYQRQPNRFLDTGGIGYASAMNIDSSINLKEAFKDSLKPQYNENGEIIGYEESEPDSPVHRWAIQPKFETPVLDFSGVSYDVPLSGSGSIATGMWHQYGRIPEGNKGIFLHIKDVDPLDIYYGPSGNGGNAFVGGTAKWTEDNLRSLGDACGFLKEKAFGGKTTSRKKKIGDLNDKKTIREAVIAIPFRKVQNNKLHFYDFPREFVDYALTVKKGSDPDSGNKNLLFEEINPATGKAVLDDSGNAIKLTPDKSIIEMTKKLQNYVLPPHLDFITYKDMTPFVAYVFEFEHELTKLDLSDIWQNLSPRSLMSIKEPKESVATVTHSFLMNDFFGLTGKATKHTSRMETDTQWMIFKVKQKASQNYFAKTASSYDQFKFKKVTTPLGNAAVKTDGSKFLKEYSYNWPYDFFSMVELVKLQAEVSFSEGQETAKGVLYEKKIHNKDEAAPGATQADAQAAQDQGFQGPQGNNNWMP